ncbi:MAG: Gfo/Idh/MocA family oxidoreductase, partial [Planctomycetia bacterium]|nr:Gfo/Idh/MocA family oxidoreductase [Planctomycetia bacterium]
MKLTRRQFVQTAAVLMPALPMFVPSRAFGANDRIGVAVVAAGSRGKGLAGFFSDDPRSTVRYITDPYLDLAKRACHWIEKRYGYRPEPLADFRSALEDKHVDVVACAAANHWHALTAIWAMQAGKHCYIEKPLTYNLFESKAVVAAAKKSGVVFQTGTQCRSAINIIQLVDFIRSGGIGEVKFVRALCYKRRKTIGPRGVYELPKSVDYDFWCGPAPFGPMTRKKLLYDWHWQRQFGNGDLGNQGSHQLD